MGLLINWAFLTSTNRLSIIVLKVMFTIPHTYSPPILFEQKIYILYPSSHLNVS